METSNIRNKNLRTNKTPLDVGRIPPQAIDVEQAVLGAIMIDNNALTNVMGILGTKEVFYDPKHQVIFEAIKVVNDSSNPVDIITVAEQLKKQGELEIAGGAYYLSTLSNKIGSAAHVEHHSRIILEKYIQRKMIESATESLRNSYDETKDVFEVLDQSQAALFEIAKNHMTKGYDTVKDTIDIALEEITKAMENTSGISGVPTGLKDLDRVTAGWQPSDMIVIAARPAMGKTAFVLSMARNIAIDYKKPVAIFSLEMSSVQLVKRLISSESGINAKKLRTGNLKDHELIQIQQKIDKLSNAPIFIDDTPGIKISDLRTKCRQMAKDHGIQMVIIDYLQLMSAGSSKSFGGNREQEISQISRSIKEIAKELNIPIIVLSQLNRSVETRGGDKKPVLSDLRESGAIEQDADIVAFIHRPEYYNITEDEEGNSTIGIGNIIIAKHRNGETTTVSLRFQKEFAKFDNLDSYGGEFGASPELAYNQSSMPVGASFTEEGNNRMVIQSRMNEDTEDKYDFDAQNNDLEETPF